ncbi:MAG: hypothetical protein Q7U52_15490 [Hydrogenophaga sp.]|uniref:hypothetical protein n=1 Tax=Hydrogenophaga sp. TaxID=1904254 RepID=UPI00271910C0|nr:hypothetical protein [Hydrogenophaga sp.]MDO9149035.1 hypothetical protein [Hydrogenophaga sp.]MDO9606769.1 hypothetical protein [Hydrogenophaga sp.]
MPNITTILSVAILVALAFFLWKRYAVGSGRAFGNRLAKHNGLRRSTFWYLIKNGVEDSAFDFLKSLEQSHMSLDQASVAVGPTLQKGMERLEARFGTQAIYEEAKPIVARLAALNVETAVDHA